MAAAVVLPDGRAVSIRVPGVACSTRAELHAIELAADHAAPFTTVFTDSRAAHDALNAAKPPLGGGEVFPRVLQKLQARGIRVKWEKGHAGNPGNEETDLTAKKALEVLPPPQPEPFTQPGQVRVNGGLERPHHKYWTRRRAPQHGNLPFG